MVREGEHPPHWTPDSDIDLRARHPDFQTFVDFNESASQRACDALRHTLDVPYGPQPLQRMDLFPGATLDAPVMVFIHGGYWRALDKQSYRFTAAAFASAGYGAAIVNYRLMPAVRMQHVIADVQQALRSLLDGEVRSAGLHPRRLAIAGHSAGGHLAITAPQQAPDVHSAICAIASLSGLFDLGRIQRSRLNETLQLSDDEVQQFSPLGRALVDVPTHAGVGGAETPLYLDETARLAAAAHVRPVIYEALNHYQAVHLLGDESAAPTTFLLNALSS